MRRPAPKFQFIEIVYHKIRNNLNYDKIFNSNKLCVLGIKNYRHLGAICSTFLRFAFSVERKGDEISHCIAKGSF